MVSVNAFARVDLEVGGPLEIADVLRDEHTESVASGYVGACSLVNWRPSGRPRHNTAGARAAACGTRSGSGAAFATAALGRSVILGEAAFATPAVGGGSVAALVGAGGEGSDKSITAAGARGERATATGARVELAAAAGAREALADAPP